MDISDLRQKFIDYFHARGYQKHPASAVVPENDPSVLFTTAGMQQFKHFYTEPDAAPAKRLATVQPVIRTTDISEVGDNTHMTKFEMLGIFSFGDNDINALKNDAITDMWQFINQELNVSKNRVFATIFAGDADVPRDTQAEEIWQQLGITIKEAGREDNFWGPTGDEGPCGPTTEIYIDNIEVGNLVFNQYYQDRQGKLSLLGNAGLDFGSSLERLATTLQRRDAVWQIEPFTSWVSQIDPSQPRESRIVIDHLKAIVFLVSAQVVPGNKGRDYILRRLIRKTAFIEHQLGRALPWAELIQDITNYYQSHYPLWEAAAITDVVKKETEQFHSNLQKAIHQLERWVSDKTQKRDEKSITDFSFYLYESFGFPKELFIEHLVELGWSVNNERFAQLFKAHQEVSRAGAAGQFKGGLADHNEQTIKHHTAHHLLLAALREVLGPSVVQKGSNVTSERLRLDFNFERKLSPEELSQIEKIVNEKIKANLPVTREEMPKEQALQSGALAEFGQKYGDLVSVYTIGDFSKELCGGPHVKSTGQLGSFQILKEEASSQGVRRIKAKAS